MFFKVYLFFVFLKFLQRCKPNIFCLSLLISFLFLQQSELKAYDFCGLNTGLKFFHNFCDGSGSAALYYTRPDGTAQWITAENNIGGTNERSAKAGFAYDKGVFYHLYEHPDSANLQIWRSTDPTLGWTLLYNSSQSHLPKTKYSADNGFAVDNGYFYILCVEDVVKTAVYRTNNPTTGWEHRTAYSGIAGGAKSGFAAHNGQFYYFKNNNGTVEMWESTGTLSTGWTWSKKLASVESGCGFEAGFAAGDCVTDLSVTMSVDRPIITVGEYAIFTVTATNYGPSNDAGVTVQDLLPSGYTYYTHGWDGGTYTPGTGIWSLGTLNVGESRKLMIYATGKSTGDYTNVATISGANFDNNTSNNTASASVQVQVPFSCADNRLFLSQGSTGNVALYDINRSTNPFTYPIIGNASGLEYNAIGYNVQDNFLYGMRGNATLRNRLVRIDAVGAVTDLGEIPGLLTSRTFFSGDMDTDGFLYVHGNFSGNDNFPGIRDKIYKVNVSTRTVAATLDIKVGGIIVGLDIVDMALCPVDGFLYTVTTNAVQTYPNRLFKINRTTGDATAIGLAVAGLGDFGAMYADANGNIFGNSNSGGFYQIDKISGTRTLISASPSASLNDGAMCATSIFNLATGIAVTKRQVVSANNRTTVSPALFSLASTITYEIVVSNTGPFGAAGVGVVDGGPAGFPNPTTNISYTASTAGGAATQVSGTQTGGINDIVDLPVGGSVTYIVEVVIPSNLSLITLNNTVTVTPPISSSQYGATVQASHTSTRRNFWVGTVNDLWDNTANWAAQQVPSSGQNIEFATTANNGGSAAINHLVVPAATEKTIGNLTNLSGKALVIPANTGVKVQGVVSGSETNSDRIVIQAAADQFNGSFIVDCASNTAKTIQATVQLFAKGYKGTMQTWTDNISGSPTNGQTFSSSYKWQYFGVPVASVKADPTFYNGFLREYDQAKNAEKSYYNKWHDLNNNSVLTAFKGYSVTQDAPTIYNIKGALQFCDKEITLTRFAPSVTDATGLLNNTRYGLGQNIFGNSFTAAIPINQINFNSIKLNGHSNPNEGGSLVEKTVYLYNTGSFGDWAGGSTSSQATTAGSYIAVPSNVGEAVYAQIPSMQGFLLRHTGLINDIITMTLPYASVVKNDRPQTAPRKALSYLEIALTSASTKDKLWLFNVPGTSVGFDNGWDGHKFFGTPTAFIYSPTPDGNLQVNTTDNIIGANIAFVANSDKHYTLSIKKSNLDDQYRQLYLLDIAERKTILLDNDTTVYSFIANSAGIPSLRFAISDNPDGLAQSTDKDLNAYVYENTLFAFNKTNADCRLQIHAINGQMLYRENVAAFSLFSDNIRLEKGAYLIVMQSANGEFSSKFIIN